MCKGLGAPLPEATLEIPSAGQIAKLEHPESSESHETLMWPLHTSEFVELLHAR